MGKTLFIIIKFLSYAFFILFIIIYPLYFFFRGVMRKWEMKRLSKEMGLMFKCKEKVGGQKIRNLIWGEYKEKFIKIYEKYPEWPARNRIYLGKRDIVIVVDNKIIYSSFNKLMLFNPSARKIKKLIDEYFETGSIKNYKMSDKVFYGILAIGIIAFFIWLGIILH